MLMQYGKTNIVITSRRGTPLEHVNAKSRVRSQANPWGIYDGQNGTGVGCFRLIRYSSVNIIPPVFHTHITFIHNWFYVILSNKTRIET